jgi:tyrosyl-tRNA synthetase
MTTLKERLFYLTDTIWNNPGSTPVQRALAKDEMSKIHGTDECKAWFNAKQTLHDRHVERGLLEIQFEEAKKQLDKFLAVDKALETTVSILGDIPCPKV